MPQSTLIALAAGVLLGALIAWLVLRGQHPALLARVADREKEVARLHGELAGARDEVSKAGQERARMAGTLESERAGFADKVALLEGAKTQLKEAFASASQEALQTNNQAFLDLAQAKLSEFQRAAQTDLEARQQSIDLLVKPVNEGLQRVDERLLAFDKEREDEQACRHVEDSHGDGCAERVEPALCGVRYRERHRAEDSDLARGLNEPPCGHQGARCALEPKQLDAIANLRRLHNDELPCPRRALLADRGPGFAGDEVDNAAHDSVGHCGPVEECKHDSEEGHALLCVEAPVHRVDEYQRIVGPEAAPAGLLGQHGESLAVIGGRLQLAEDDCLRRPVDLHRCVTAGAHSELHTTSLGPGQRLDYFAHACADALEEREPVGRCQRGRRVILRYFEIWLLKLEGFLPDIRRCGECHRGFDENESAFMNSDLMFRCSNCSRGAGSALSNKLQTQLRATQRLAPYVFAQESRTVPRAFIAKWPS